MRPEILFPLFADVKTLAGVGPKVRERIERLAGNRVVDLLWHFPVSVVDRRAQPLLRDAVVGRIGTVRIVVDRHEPGRDRRRPYKVHCHDESGRLVLVFFGGDKSYLERQLPVGETRLVSGTFERFAGQLQMSHPDYIVPPVKADDIPDVETVYPGTGGLSPKTLRKAVNGAVESAPELPEWLSEAMLAKEEWPGWRDALKSLHHPVSADDLDAKRPPRRRLAYDELLASQLTISLVREQGRKRKGVVLSSNGQLRDRLIAALPFTLTGAQTKAVDEILADLASNAGMLRLLQGDVGSGKTIVALLAMTAAVEAGKQAALLAPTEILAKQHYAGIQDLAGQVGLRLGFLSGRLPASERREVLEQLAEGQIDILIGTHAVFQDKVDYSDLGLVIIDEQHRFGVHQRVALQRKGRRVNVLVMTATPIPRTLTLAVYGDMDVSRITEKPPGRTQITTRVVSQTRVEEVIAAVGRALQTGERVYWVCPLIEESDTSELTAATERFEALRAVFGDKVGLVHGRMSTEERDRAMADFTSGRTCVLVATTVIEVGVDVPEATIMIVEQAERFGLAQLHQLRGRVGRGERASTCLLLRASHIGEIAEERLRIMRDTEDGFVIAEADLKLRGTGELLGTRQSGDPTFHVADLAAHGDLLTMAHDEARLIIAKDPGLESDRGSALKVLLYLFEREVGVRLLGSG